jgi:hypothetical protein
MTIFDAIFQANRTQEAVTAGGGGSVSINAQTPEHMTTTITAIPPANLKKEVKHECHK